MFPSRLFFIDLPLVLKKAGHSSSPGAGSLLLSRLTVISAAVACIAPVGSDLETGSLALVTYRTILFHMLCLLLLFHGELIVIFL